jgi:hypothetical protein
MAACSRSDRKINHLYSEDKDGHQTSERGSLVIELRSRATQAGENAKGRESNEYQRDWQIDKAVRNVQQGQSHSLILMQMICICIHLA